MAPLSGEEMKVEVEERMDQMESNLSKYHRRADRLLLQLEKMKEVIEADAADRYPNWKREMSLLKPCTSSGSGISGNGIHESDRDRFIEECSELLSKGENLIDEWAEKGNILEAGSPANGKDDDGPTSTPIPVLASILEAKNNDTGLGLGATATSTVTGGSMVDSAGIRRAACVVCGDKAARRHFGVYSCNGCNCFFKRAIRKQLECYSCRGSLTCEVTKDTRNSCHFCRLQKCIRMGMRSKGGQPIMLGATGQDQKK